MAEHDSEIRAYLSQLYSEDLRAHSFTGNSRDEFEAWAAGARPVLRELIGLDRIRQDNGGFEPSVDLEESELFDGYTRRKGILHTEPDFDIPFWFLKPEGEGPFPLGLFPHGHHNEHGLDYAAGIPADEEMRLKIETQDRDVAVQAVRRGFAAIAPATRGFLPACIPDITGRHDGRNCRSQLMHSLLAGRTVTGERCWDMECLIDWAGGLADIDISTVLMMGNSGGGTMTLYAAACDERITIAVASCAFSTFVRESGHIHHCDCNAVPGIMRFGEFHDVAGMIAPRHLLAVHGRTDGLFTVPAVEVAAAGAQTIFDAAGIPDHFEQKWGPEGHRFYSDLMWPFVMECL